MGLLRWFRKKSPDAARPRADESRLVRPGMDLDQGIAAIAALRSEAAIQANAWQFARQFGPAVIPELAHRFDVLVAPPPSFSARDPSACAWISCWQTALFEILYQYREHALPVLREMAGRGYPAAVVQLCRLAAEGVDRRQVIEDLGNLLPDLPHGVRCDVAASLLWLAGRDAALAAVLDELRQVPAFEKAFAEVREFEGPPPGEPRQTAGRPGRGVGLRVALAAVALGAGAWVGVAVVDSVGLWGAVLVGALAAVLGAAVAFLLERVALPRDVP